MGELKVQHEVWTFGRKAVSALDCSEKEVWEAL